MEEWKRDARKGPIIIDIDPLVPADHLLRKIEKVMGYEWLYERTMIHSHRQAEKQQKRPYPDSGMFVKGEHERREVTQTSHRLSQGNSRKPSSGWSAAVVLFW